MEKEKQIEEMAKVLSYKHCMPLLEDALPRLAACKKEDSNCRLCEAEKIAVNEIAQALINAGYGNVKEARKETAREILEYIVKSGSINVAPDTIKMFFKERYGVEDEK